ncbi:MAG: hemerythrin domain-containing protein [Planctomycetes bacterium]|nr:hemerythrin domain-containing protein [Planctomycetota bacterium]
MTKIDLNRGTDHEIADEHDELRRLLQQFQRLLAARNADRHELTIRMTGLANLIESHFGHEEEEGGYFSEVLAEAPRLQQKIDILRQQHAEFRTTLDQFRALSRVHRGSPRCWQALEQLFYYFLGEFLEHERMENGLVQEAYERDLGDSE